jgi:hypothetical protein
VSVKVSPAHAFRFKLPDGTLIEGPRGAVRRAGTLRVTPGSKKTPRNSPLPADTVSGFDLSAPGGALAKPVTISFPAPRKPDVAHALPVIVHVDSSGRWSYDSAIADHGHFTIRTNDFSFRAPSWLNPVAWVQDLFHAAANTVTGRTSPPKCANVSIPWATLKKKTTLLHACLKSNPDRQGAARAEAYLKANRDLYLKVAYATGADYAWQEHPTRFSRSRPSTSFVARARCFCRRATG